jgi:PPOX class probable F420-dependent enzyme
MARDRGVEMASDAVAEVLDEQRTVTLATIGPDGMPHLAAMWFVREGSGDDMTVLMWTYGTSQKAHNLRRDPRAAVMAEGGEAYDQLRGVCLDCEVEVVESEDLWPIGLALFDKYMAPPGMTDEQREAGMGVLRKQAQKRVGLRMRVVRARSWDHRKLG